MLKTFFAPLNYSGTILLLFVEFAGYGGFAAVVVEKNIPVLFKIEFSSEFIQFLNDNNNKNRIDKYSSEDEKINTSLCCDHYF